MAQDTDVLKKIYNAFDPGLPLRAGDPAYTECHEVRGDQAILKELGREILLSDRPTSQLYAGHRGSGKSTELLRLKKHLEENDCKVVYFAANEEDIDPEDVRYSDILLACTRHLLEELKDEGDSNSLLSWMKERWQGLKDLATTKIEFDKLSVSAKIGQFAKLTANLRAVPSTRQKIREQIGAHTVSLLDALNEFVETAKRASGKNLVVIADNLDRIVPVYHDDSKRLNHDEIFLDRSEQLSALQCHTVYTVTISMVYSPSGVHLDDRYGRVNVLPMISVRDRSTRRASPRGMKTLKNLILNRLRTVDDGFALKTLFQNDKLLAKLCLMSGGHMRDLVRLVRIALNRTSALPIPPVAVNRAISEMRETYRKAVLEDAWALLAKVSRSKQMPNEAECRRLLFDRCILEYRQLDRQQQVTTWHDVNPLIEDIEQFRQALEGAADGV